MREFNFFHIRQKSMYLLYLLNGYTVALQNLGIVAPDSSKKTVVCTIIFATCPTVPPSTWVLVRLQASLRGATATRREEWTTSDEGTGRSAHIIGNNIMACSTTFYFQVLILLISTAFLLRQQSCRNYCLQ